MTLKLYLRRSISLLKRIKNIVDIVIQKRGLKLFINKTKNTLDDSKMLARDVSNIGHWGNGDYEIVVSDDSNIEYIMSLIKQVIK